MKHGLLDPAALADMICDSLDESDDIVFVLEQIGSGETGLVIAAANRQFCRTSGYTHAEVVGRPLSTLAVSDKNLTAYDETLKAASVQVDKVGIAVQTC